MPYLPLKPDEVRKGQQALSAEGMNRTTRAIRRQVRGGHGVTVQEFGDRTLLSADQGGISLPDPRHYFQPFVVREELADSLRCVPYVAPTGPSGDWTTAAYDKDLGKSLENDKSVFVAKPPTFRESYWSGKQVPAQYPSKLMKALGRLTGVASPGDDFGVRTIAFGSWNYQTNSYYASDADTITQHVLPAYEIGDIIVASRQVTGVLDQQYRPIYWEDTNRDGRRWVTEDRQLYAVATGAPLSAGGYYSPLTGRLGGTMVTIGNLTRLAYPCSIGYLSNAGQFVGSVLIPTKGISTSYGTTALLTNDPRKICYSGTLYPVVPGPFVQENTPNGGTQYYFTEGEEREWWLRIDSSVLKPIYNATVMMRSGGYSPDFVADPDFAGITVTAVAVRREFYDGVGGSLAATLTLGEIYQGSRVLHPDPRVITTPPYISEFLVRGNP